MNEHSDFWRKCSGEIGKERVWTLARAQAFQEAVEHRAFALYQSYYAGLGFRVWLEREE